MFKKYPYVTILILLSIIFVSPLFLGNYESHDQTSHLARIAEYSRVISEGQFIPRWAGYLNYGYGTPLFIIYYPLAGYISALIHLAGLSIEVSYFSLVIPLFIISPLFFYLWLKERFDEEISFFASVFYLTLPYRFLTLFVRSGVGEFMSFSLLPLVFLFLEKYLKRPRLIYILRGALVYTLIILSHNAVSLVFTPIILLYGIVNGKKGFIYSALSIILGLGISSFFWVPSLVESKYTSFLFFFRNMYQDQFPSVLKYIYTPWGFGPDVNKSGGLSPQIGPFSFVILILAVLFVYQLKKEKNEQKNVVLTSFWIAVFVLGFYISSSLSWPFWHISDFLKKFQFPWRFIMIPSFAAAALSPFVFVRVINRKIVYFFLFLILIFSIQYAEVKQYVSRPDSFYYKYPGTTFYHGEATTMWSGGDPNMRFKKKIEVIGGNAKVSSIKVKANRQSFDFSSTNDSIILVNTIYFPGWRAYIDGVEVPIQFQDVNHKGLITFNVPVGIHEVSVVFTETKVRLVSDLISFGSVVLLVILFVYNFAKWKR